MKGQEDGEREKLRETALVPGTPPPRESVGKPQVIEVEIREGQYWRCVGDGRWAGQVRLVVEVERVEGEPHTVTLQSPPNVDGGKGAIGILAEDLVQEWREALDWEAVRTAQVAQVEKEIGMLEQGLATLRSEPLPQLEWTGLGPDPHRINPARDMARSHALALQERKTALERKGKALQEAVKRVGPFYKERVLRSKVRHAGVFEEVEGAERTLDVLNLFAGEGVEVLQWGDGRPAQAEEPLRIYQRLRYMDQLTLWGVLEGDGHGADCRDLEAWLRQVGAGGPMLGQVCPAARGVVAVEVRKHQREYGSLEEAMQYTEGNHATFLMVRNGAKVWSVHFHMGSGRARLVPRRDEWLHSFTVRDPWDWKKAKHSDEMERVGPGDLGYAERYAKAKAKERSYLRPMVVLAGWHIREGTLGPLQGEEEGDRLNLLKPDAWHGAVEVVRDEEDVLDVGLPGWRTVLAQANRSAGPLGHAAIVPRRLEEQQEHWESRRYGGSLRVSDDGARVLPIERDRQGRLYVGVYVHERKARQQMRLEGGRWSGGWDPLPGWLHVEGMDEGMLADQLAFRREDYQEIAPMAVPALKWRKEQREEQAEICRRMARAAGVAPEQCRDVVRIVTDQVRRSPRDVRKKAAAAKRLVLARDALETTEQEWKTALGEGRIPVRLQVDASGVLKLYARGGGHDRTLGRSWLASYVVDGGEGGKLQVAPAGPAALPRGVALKEWRLTPKQRAAMDVHRRGMDWAEARALEEEARTWPERALRTQAWVEERMSNPATAKELVGEVVRQTYAKTSYRSYVQAVSWGIWIGLVRGAGRDPGEAPVYALVYVREAFAMLAAAGGREGLEAVEQGVRRLYRNPDSKVESMQVAAERGPRGGGDLVVMEAETGPGEATLRPKQVEGKRVKEWICAHREVFIGGGRKLMRKDRLAWSKRGEYHRSEGPAGYWLLTPGPGPGSWAHIPRRATVREQQRRREEEVAGAKTAQAG